MTRPRLHPAIAALLAVAGIWALIVFVLWLSDPGRLIVQ